WLLALAPEARVGRTTRLLLFGAGLLPPLLVAYAYARQFGLDPRELAWTGVLLVAGGGIGPLAVLVWAIVLGCTVAVLALVLRDPHDDVPPGGTITVRGPVSYAGPGSLGGTESALRR
ncbi:MAG: hypothetical protein WBC33_05810, partial [Conexibacter sp.]